jgi:hypothetical protein
MARNLWVAVLFVAACGVDGEAVGPDAGVDADSEVTCADVRANGVEVGVPAECGLSGYGYVVPGVSYYESATDTTWFQRVVEYQGEAGVVGQIDEWTAGCHWFPCEATR